MGVKEYWGRLKSGFRRSWSLDDSSLQNFIWHYTALIKILGVDMNMEMTKHELCIRYLVVSLSSFLLVQLGYIQAIQILEGHIRLDTESSYVGTLAFYFQFGWILFKRQKIMELLNMALKQNVLLTPIEEVTLEEEMKTVKWRCRTCAVIQTIIIIVYFYSPIVMGTASTVAWPIIFPGMEDETTVRNIVIYNILRHLLAIHIVAIIYSFWLLFATIVGQACGHAKAIAAQISTLKPSDKNLTSKIRYVVQRHQQHNLFVTKINSLYTLVMGIDMAVYLTATSISFQEPGRMTIVFIAFIFTEALLYCYFGQSLINAGEMIERAIYNADWHEMKPSDAKVLLLMLMNSQEPLQLTSFKLIQLNHTTYMSFVRMFYSSFSCIAANKDKKN